MKKTILIVALIFIADLLRASSLGDSNVVVANDTCKAIDKYLTKLSLEKNFSGCLLIVKNGKKIFSKGYGWANKELKIPFTPVYARFHGKYYQSVYSGCYAEAGRAAETFSE
jgi:hypothetical protein